MKYFEDLSHNYPGFYEGEYMHRYFLPESLRFEISPRDLLAVYWLLRGFTARTPSRQMKPSVFRNTGALQQIEAKAKALLEDSLTIHYTQEKLSREIPVEQVIEIVAVCHSYMRALADTELDESETDQLIGLNECLRGLQLEATKRVFDMRTARRNAGENIELRVRYSFELNDDNPVYRDLDHNTLFSVSDFIYSFTPAKPEEGLEEMRQRDLKDWNDKYHIINRLFQTPHCRLFHWLEDCSAAPLRHLLRIGRVTAFIEAVTSFDMLMSPSMER